MAHATTIVITGDCLNVLRTVPDASIDAVVTDPPYGLSKQPDALEVLRHWLDGDDYEHKGSGFMGKTWDSFVPGPSIWREVLRVLKPGGHACVFAGSRTVDLMGLSLRIAGFEIRDQLQWLYGTGFPKSLDVSKAIDATILTGGSSPRNQADARESTGQAQEGGGTHAFKASAGSRQGVYRNKPGSGSVWEPQTADAKRWAGWGTALKPAHEPIILARKPLSGTVAKNVLEHGTGALNIDGCRIGSDGGGTKCSNRDEHGRCLGHKNAGQSTSGETFHGPETDPGGRWPANVILDPEAGAALDEQSGITKSRKAPRGSGIGYHGGDGTDTEGRGHDDSGGASRFFYTAKASRAEREAGLEHMRKASAGELTGGRKEGSAGLDNPRAGAGRKSAGRANVHPTVKPISLMRWLVRLVCPPGGVVLDPFTGSGSTGCAAVQESETCAAFVGIELSPEYAEIARARIEHWRTRSPNADRHRTLHWGARAEQLDFAELGAVVRTAPLTQYAPVDTLPSMAKNDDPLVQRAGVTNLDTAHLLMCRLSSHDENRWELRDLAREGKQLPHRLDSSPFSIARDFPGFAAALAELAPMFAKLSEWSVRHDERKRLAERVLGIAARGMPEAMAVVQLFAGLGDPDPDNWRTKKKDEPATAGFERWTNCRELAELIRAVRKANPKPKPKPKTKNTTKKSSSSKSSAKKTTKRTSSKKPPQRALPSPASKPSAAKRTKHDEGDAPAKSANDAGPLAASASDALTTFLAGKSVGDEFQVGDVLKLTTASRSSVVRACSTNVKVQQEGKGRGAKWKVVA